jgi:hypothetical protein
VTKLNDFTIRELEEEIKRRALNITPLPIIERDYTTLEELVESHVKSVIDQVDSDDDEHYIYETAMETIYGKEIWDKLKDYWGSL